ncbi:MAG: Asp-tRNA(Asn)/Glu-tRNA(Gln) amidotransferase subunit GatC [Clostridia bacterium]|nr:Asp-tRNA(Asn)/Glu-tRNA(Gln) amidotransferase subunit GatC [Clostridia bacterium]MBQ2152673.1 Asp-tRNA(Asn)/Glu-tRNA(Gln) amidotransferase subunit GatC [Clostridia bacterium]MBQ5439853.1 Asp-tRNA(Asn)/Glu-tRNA(Gln) amidotransferase subunit GatC [Clostridia bacterium]
MVTHDDVMAIARLSKLYIAEDELDEMTKAMDDIIKFADTINNAADEGIEFDNINNLSNSFRTDEVVTSYDREEILKNANDIDEGHFLVRKRV